MQRGPRTPIVIKPSRGWPTLGFAELVAYRDLLLMLAGRDVKLRYKQTVLGILWVILQPLMAALIFATIFGRFAHLPSDHVPYILFVFCGLLPWNYLAGAMQRAGTSLVTDAKLISKVYFPRLIVPLASTVAVLIDLAVGLVVLLVLMLLHGMVPTWRVLFLPAFLLLTTLLATGVSFWLCALNAHYRDFGYAMPFLIQVWMYASPVAYSMTVVPTRLRWLFSINPAVGSIEGFRWALLGRGALSTEMVCMLAVTSLALFVSGACFFRLVERRLVDVL